MKLVIHLEDGSTQVIEPEDIAENGIVVLRVMDEATHVLAQQLADEAEVVMVADFLELLDHAESTFKSDIARQKVAAIRESLLED